MGKRHDDVICNHLVECAEQLRGTTESEVYNECEGDIVLDYICCACKIRERVYEVVTREEGDVSHLCGVS